MWAESRLAWRLALRDLRGGMQGLGIFLACLVLGVAAIAAVGTLNTGVRDALARDARVLFGGDIEIEGGGGPVGLDQLGDAVPDGTLASYAARTATLAYAPDGRSIPIVLQAVDDAYPLLGRVRLDPDGELAQAVGHGRIAVEAALLPRLGLALGDRVRIGTTELTLAAVIERQPDRVGGLISLGPRVLVSVEDATNAGLLQAGSLVDHETTFLLPPGDDPAAVAAALGQAFPDAPWKAESYSQSQPRIARFTGQLGTYLTLAGLATLLVGGVGIALATRTHLAGKTRTIAVLKSLGAPSSLAFRIFLVQVLAVTGVGMALGLLLGQALPLLIRLVPENVLPVQVDVTVVPSALLTAAAAGLLTVLLFTLWPLARAGQVPPARLFRDQASPLRRLPGRRPMIAMTVVGVLLALVAVLGVPDRRLGMIFVAVAFVAAVSLAGCAHLLLDLLGRLTALAPARYRLPLANLRRPGSAAPGVATALGAGLTVLTCLALLQSNLGREVAVRLPERAPSLFVIDIQPGQAETFRQVVDGTPGASLLETAPVLRGRVTRIGDTPVDQVAIDPSVAWTVRRDRGLTYSGPVPPATEITAGSWWEEDYAGPPLVSVDEAIARGYGVGIGDTLTFNVLGRDITAEIGSLRHVAWEDAKLNFVFIFSPGLLSSAPYTNVAAVEVPAGAEPALLQDLSTAIPNATPISVRDLVAQASELLGQIGFAVGSIGAVTLVSGLLVLVGAVAAARRRHLYDAVVLKVLGARRADLLRNVMIEYLCLGVIAAVIGGVLGSAGAWLITTIVMNIDWHFSSTAVVRVALLALVLVVGVGVFGTRRIFGQSAGPTLRTI
ncbi:ABC transporter permease [Marinivivus vitaminiproducens]|uniref:ABC transporter permease n=1 Tax=Marinivivus vitaminiproducens TaxID=3035935 RepID=UPI0027A35A5F|nr:FtsX-like permease family protein [Geminicoccaceae bacterium SCSIO 64248]